MKKSKQDGTNLPEYTHSHNSDDKRYCRNCHKKIKTMTYKSTGVCSEDCRRALGISPMNPGELERA